MKRTVRPDILRGFSLLLFAAYRVLPYRHGRLPLDLHVYLVGGHAVLHGKDLYAASVSVQGYPFTYPPLAALPFAALAAAPQWVAVIVTIAVFYAALVAVVQACRPGILTRATTSWLWWSVVAVVLWAEPVWATLKDGQVNMVLAALVVFDLLRLRHTPIRGVLVGLAAAIKLTPAVFVLYLLVTRQFAAARNAVAGFVAVTGLAWLVLPGDSNRYWFHTLFQTARVGDVARVSNQSLLGLAHKEFDSGMLVRVVWIASALLAAGITLWLAVRLTADGQRVLAVGIVGFLSCLLSPISWTHHWVWLVPVLIGLVESPWWPNRWCRVGTLAGCGVFGYGASRPPPATPVVHLVLGNLFVLTALAAIGALALAVARQRRWIAAASPDGHSGPTVRAPAHRAVPR